MFKKTVIAALIAACTTTSLYAEPLRTVTVSVFNDTTVPVAQDTIDQLLEHVFTEYETETGINLEIIEQQEYEWNIHDTFYNQFFYLRGAREKDSDIAIVFSNRRMYHQGTAMTGMGLTLGMSFIYNTDYNYTERVDKGNNPLSETVLKHELAHVFGADHIPNQDSFMYGLFDKHGNDLGGQSVNSDGEWTDDVRQTIKTNGQRYQWPMGKD